MSSSTQHYIAGFWRRFFAFVIDTLLVSILCWIISSVLENTLFKFPVLSIFTGYLIVVLYFGLLNSQLNQGQTFAKQLLKIRVIHHNGQSLAIFPALLRAAILFAPACLMSLSSYIAMTALAWAFSTLLVILQCLIFYFYLFNRHNRRSVHDFIAHSLVINSENHLNEDVPKIWNKHYFFASAIAIVGVTYSIAMFISMGDLTPTENNQLKHMQPEIISIKEVGNTAPEFTLRMFEIQVNDPKTLNNPFFAQQFVDHLHAVRPDLSNNNEQIMLVLISKFQFGFASNTNFNMYSIEKSEAGQSVAVEQMSSLDF